MALVTCPECSSEDLRLVENLEDGRKHIACSTCGHSWFRGEAARQKRMLNTFEEIRKRFPTPADVDPAARSRAEALKAEFLTMRPEPRPEVAPYWAKYQQIFSAAGLPTASPQDLKDFANSNVGANAGNMSGFNNAWNAMGAEAAAAQVRETVEHLLRGPAQLPLEDRLTDLIEGNRGLGMPGFREALLTKVLCVMEPERFIPIVKYDGRAGKRQIAQLVYGIELPEPEKVAWRIGRLVLWSDDLLWHLVGDGFADTQHAAQFLWWAKDR